MIYFLLAALFLVIGYKIGYKRAKLNYRIYTPKARIKHEKSKENE